MEGAQHGRAGLAAPRLPGAPGAPGRRAPLRRAGGRGALGAADPALRVSAALAPGEGPAPRAPRCSSLGARQVRAAGLAGVGLASRTCTPSRSGAGGEVGAGPAAPTPGLASGTGKRLTSGASANFEACLRNPTSTGRLFTPVVATFASFLGWGWGGLLPTGGGQGIPVWGGEVLGQFFKSNAVSFLDSLGDFAPFELCGPSSPLPRRALQFGAFSPLPLPSPVSLPGLPQPLPAGACACASAVTRVFHGFLCPFPLQGEALGLGFRRGDKIHCRQVLWLPASAEGKVSAVAGSKRGFIFPAQKMEAVLVFPTNVNPW